MKLPRRLRLFIKDKLSGSPHPRYSRLVANGRVPGYPAHVSSVKLPGWRPLMSSVSKMSIATGVEPETVEALKAGASKV